jgi:hypothetical protein
MLALFGSISKPLITKMKVCKYESHTSIPAYFLAVISGFGVRRATFWDSGKSANTSKKS